MAQERDSRNRSHAGAKQPHIFSHEKADWLDEEEREAWLPTPVLTSLLALRDGETVLDFGAGTGRYAIAFAKAHPNARVIAYDVQPEFVAIIEQRIREAGLQNIRATATLDERVDRIFAANVLHEIGDEDLVTIRRALNNGAQALFIDWDADIDRPTGPPREHAHTRTEAATRLRNAGFTTIKELHDPNLPYHFIFLSS